MLHEKAVKKVEKALGVKVEKMGHRWGCVYDGYVLSWLVHPNWEDSTKLEAHNWHARRVNDHSDPMTDYFAGSHFDNITQLIHWVKPPEPKFKVGDLVKGKDNKRANRMGYANKLGIVTRAGTAMGIKWVSDDSKMDAGQNDDGSKNPSYLAASWVSYPERDFVRV